MVNQLLTACALFTALFYQPRQPSNASSDVIPSENGDQGLHQQLVCPECHMTFAKCLAAGRGLPPDAKKAHKRECTDAATKCFQKCIRGSAMTEYVVVVGAVAIVVGAAIASLGIPLITGYNAARKVLVAPAP
jgi:hypothetical protein